MNSVMTACDRAALTYFQKKVEVLNKQKYDKMKRKLINLYFASFKSDKENDLQYRKKRKRIAKRNLKPEIGKRSEELTQISEPVGLPRQV